jgi:glycosyltransferase involved in cell wall biosynthesis
VADVDLADHYRHAMVVIQPASDEGFGLQPLEALASGAPLIVAATPAVAELAGDAARVVPPGPEALSAALVELAIDLDRRQELRRAAVLTAAPFTWRATADRVIEALARAAERGRRSSC